MARLRAKDVIKTRKPGSTFKDIAIETENLTEIKNLMKRLSCDQFRFELAELKTESGVETYFITGFVDKGRLEDKVVLADFGFTFEAIILKATDIGLGNCWVNRSHMHKDAHEFTGIREYEELVVLSPLGLEATKTRKDDELSRAMHKTRRHSYLEDVFFHYDFTTPVKANEAVDFFNVMNMLWDVESDGDTDFFSFDEDRTSEHDLVTDVDVTDVGVAISQAEQALKSYGHYGEI